VGTGGRVSGVGHELTSAVGVTSWGLFRRLDGREFGKEGWGESERGLGIIWFVTMYLDTLGQQVSWNKDPGALYGVTGCEEDSPIAWGGVHHVLRAGVREIREEWESFLRLMAGTLTISQGRGKGQTWMGGKGGGGGGGGGTNHGEIWELDWVL